MNVHEINLDVSKQPAVTPVLYLGQGDKNGTTLQASIYDDGVPLSLSGKSVRFAMRSPNGQAYYEDNGTVNGNVAIFTIDETYAAAIAGVTDVAYVEVLEGSTVVCSTNRFRVVVLESAQEGADPEQAYSNGIMEAIDDANEAADDAREAAEEAREAAGGTVPLMSPTQRGGAKLGDGLEVGADEKLSVKKATTTQAGVVKPDGSTITVDPDGTLHGSSSYTLPTMSPTTKGGAKVGSGLSVSDETLNLGPLTDSGSGASVATDGCGIFGVTGEGWAEQDTTTGKNIAGTKLNAIFNVGSTIAVMGSPSSGIIYTAAVSPNTTYTVRKNGGNRLYVGSCSSLNPPNGEVMQLLVIDSGAMSTATFTTGTNDYFVAIYLSNNATSSPLNWVQLELGSTATSYEPYTGGKASPNPDYPQEIRVARGRNLFDAGNAIMEAKYWLSDQWNSGSIGAWHSVFIPVTGGKTYTTSGFPDQNGVMSCYVASDKTTVIGTDFSTKYNNKTHDVPFGASYIALGIPGNADVSKGQLELGSQATPYVPYGHIGLDITANGQTTTTPIPLPAKGFAAKLGDYADTLKVDSAGRCEWTNQTGMHVVGNDLAYSSGNASRSVFTDVVSNLPSYTSASDTPLIMSSHFVAVSQAATWVPGKISRDTLSMSNVYYIVDPSITTPSAFLTAYQSVEVLHPIAVSTTESLGYIALPELPEGATVSIPELEAIGVEWWVEGAEAIAEHGRDVSRANKEQEDRIAELEAAVANLATS